MPTTAEAPPVAGPAASSLPPSPQARETWPELYRLSAAKYRAIVEAEILGPDDKLELIDGLLVRKMPSSELHNGVIMALNFLLGRMGGNDYIVRGQMGLTLSGNAVPEPDIALVRGGYRDFFATQGTAAITQLVVEVSKTSLTFDLGRKAILYADAGIPEYWVVDVTARVVHVHTDPQPGGYASATVVGVGGSLPVTLGGHVAGTLAVKEFLP